jgi:hypothetical protein
VQVNFGKPKGLLCKIPEITDFRIKFSTENAVDRVHGAVDRGQHRSTVDRGQRARRCLADVRRAGAAAHRCSPAMEGEDEPVEAVLGRCSLATEG